MYVGYIEAEKKNNNHLFLKSTNIFFFSRTSSWPECLNYGENFNQFRLFSLISGFTYLQADFRHVSITFSTH